MAGVTRTLAALVGTGLLVIGTTACSPTCSTGDLTAASAELKAMGDDWISSARTCDVGGFQVSGPAGEPNGDLFVTSQGLQIWVRNGGNDLYVMSTNGQSGQLAEVVTVLGVHGDGEHEHISYRLSRTSGSEPASVSDYNRDGETDDKIVGDPPVGFAKVSGKWLRREKRGEEIGVADGDQWRRLTKTPAGYEFAK